MFLIQFPVVPLREAVRCGHGAVCALLPDAVSLLRCGEGPPGWRPSLCEHAARVRNKKTSVASRPVPVVSRFPALFCLQVNIGLTLLSLVAFIHPVSVYLHCRRAAKERASS